MSLLGTNFPGHVTLIEVEEVKETSHAASGLQKGCHQFITLLLSYCFCVCITPLKAKGTVFCNFDGIACKLHKSPRYLSNWSILKWWRGWSPIHDSRVNLKNKSKKSMSWVHWVFKRESKNHRRPGTILNLGTCKANLNLGKYKTSSQLGRLRSMEFV